MSNNPKAYYNQAGYNSNSRRPEKVHKPDEINEQPPPYFPSSSSLNNTQPSSPSASTITPSTYASAQEYPNYGSLGPTNQPGLLYPRHNNLYPQQPQYPSSSTSSTSLPSAYNIPDVASNYSPSPSLRNTNPHIPRDWVPDNNNSDNNNNNNNNNNNHHQPYIYNPQQNSNNNNRNNNNRNYNFSPRIRFPSSNHNDHGDGGDDDDDHDISDPGCCKKWCKYLFVTILISLVIVKYNSILPSIGWSDHGDGSIRFWQCKDQPLVLWQDLPTRIDFQQDLYISIEGGPVTVSGGSIQIYPSLNGERRDSGWIETKVQVSKPFTKNKEELYYQLERLDNDDLTHFILHLPLWESSNHPCVKIDMNVYLPHRLNSLRMNVNNLPIYLKATSSASDAFSFTSSNTSKMMMMGDDNELKLDQLELITTNAPIQSDLIRWKGDTLALKTTNGDINLSAGVMEAKDWISLQSTNAALIANTLIAKDKIDTITTNGKILMQSISVKNSLHVSSTNAPISLESQVNSNEILIQTSNGPIHLAHIYADASLTVATTNNDIKANVVGDKESINHFNTFNGLITLYMTNEYEGLITAGTSRSNRVMIDDTNIRYDSNQRHYKQGQRFNGNGIIELTTTNNDVKLYFYNQ
ncbi:unnamed protein product [Cunninghamella blakesleeana]